MTYEIPPRHQVHLVYDDPSFLSLLHSAQDGDQRSQELVILATLPLVFSLTSDEDEVSELICCLYEKILPKWTETFQWGGHAKRYLTWRLRDLRRLEQKRVARGY